MALWVRLLVGSLVFLGVLVCVFLQRYFGIYLLRGISTLDARALPRAPMRLRAYLRAYVRLCAFPLARLGSSLVRFCIAPISLWLRHVVPVRFSFRFCRFPVRFGCLPLSRLFAWLFCAPVRSSFVYLARFGVCWVTLLHGSLWRSYFVRRWRYHSFILLHSASYSFFLTHVHLKLSYINHVFSVY